MSLATKHSICVFVCAVMVLCVFGCQSTKQDQKPVSFASPSASEPFSKPVQTRKSGSRQVAFQDVDAEKSNVGLIPLTVDETSTLVFKDFVTNDDQGSVTLAELEQLLVSSHPEILKAKSQLAALEGKKLQAGLGPNPNAGLIGDDINADGGAGRYGVFYSQQVVRGGKLELAQSAVCAELDVARNKLNAIKQRLLVELRKRYYNVLLAQETVRQTRELADVLQKAVDTSEKLFEAEEIAKAPVLRSQVELQNVNMMVRQSENQRKKALRMIAAMLGESNVVYESLAGDVRDSPSVGEFESAFDQMLENHPELSAAFASIEQAQRKLAQQRVAPIPNLTWQTNLQYDFTTDEIVGGFQVGMPIPRFNRNQGAILQAQQDIQSSVHAADQKVLELRDRLNESWANYVDAKIQVETLDNELLPKSAEALELASEGYRQGETPYLELLLAQQLFVKTKLGYLQKLQQRWVYEVEIRGLIANYESCL